ncbi:hypothetical protein [Parapedobacter koreensis]|uniref:HTTM-like domain-containing protein n=1 Tax=Parapedobacter koreensis TaxID=332977 RepID=A0A1H7MEW0_9SPHI|nr:hypothetical protein [Parapedobacter koreensis]SEL09448.1 hypothetical protein SAMN05421740_103478 [Parapedobacter koreensis]
MTHPDRFLFGFSGSHHWVPILRIGISALLLAAQLLLWPDFAILYGADRFVDAPLLALKQGKALLPLGSGSQDVAPLAYILLCVAVIIGFYPRIAVVLLLLLHQLTFLSNPLFSYGFDYLACSALFYAAIAPSERTLIPWHSLLLRTIQLHLCVVYAVAGINKAFGTTWWTGEALWKAIMQPGYLPVIATELAKGIPTPWWVAAGWLVVLLELCYPVLIWLPRTRRLCLWATVALHTGIALAMGLHFFSALMILLNVVAFHYPYLPVNNQQTSTSPMVKPLRVSASGRETPAPADHADTNQSADA